MLAQAARAAARAVARKVRTSGGKSNFGATPERAYATEVSSDGTTAKKSSGLLAKIVGGAALLVGGVYLGDLYMNDDLDNLSEVFRRRLSDEERKDRYVTLFSIDSDMLRAESSEIMRGFAGLCFLSNLSHLGKGPATLVRPRAPLLDFILP